MPEPPQCMCVWERVVRRIVLRLDDGKMSERLRSRDHSSREAALHVLLTLRGPNREAILTVDSRSADLDGSPICKKLVGGQIEPCCNLSAISINLSCRSLQSRFSGLLTYVYNPSSEAAFLAPLLCLRDQIQESMCWKANSSERRNAFCGEMIKGGRASSEACRSKDYCAVYTSNPGQ